MREGIIESLLAWVGMMCFILVLARFLPRWVPTIGPPLRPVGRGVAAVMRPLRMPAACTIAVAAVVLIGFVIGCTWGYLRATEARTCAWVPGIAGAAVYTCEYGHSYHDQLAEMGQT